MGIVDNVVARWATRRGYVKLTQDDLKRAPSWALASAAQGTYVMPSGAIAGNQAELYQRLSWVMGATNLISASIASYPLNVKKRVGEDVEDIPNHEFEMRLHDPNPLLVPFELIEFTANWMALTGNCYWWLNAPGPTAPPTEIWLIPPDKLQPIPDGKLYIRGYHYQDGGYTEVLPVDEIIHFRRFHPRNDFVGLSPIEALATIAVGDLKMQEWNTNFFAEENAKLPYLLAFADMIPDALWDKMKAEFKRDFGGTKRGLPLLRGAGAGGVQALQLGVPQKDMEFLAGRKWNKEEIMFVYGVHPGMVDPNATEANATVARANFAEYTLWPMMQRIAQTIGKHILPRYGDNLMCEFEDPRISDQRLELDQITVRKDYYTIDELRAMEDKEPIGDERGELTVIELKAGKTGGPVPAQLEGFTGQPGEEPSEAPLEEPQEEETEPEEPPVPQKAYAKDLLKWRKKAIRALDSKGYAVCAFAAKSIPADVRNEIAIGLARVRERQQIYDVFAGPLEEAESAAPPPSEVEALLAVAASMREAAAAVTQEAA